MKFGNVWGVYGSAPTPLLPAKTLRFRINTNQDPTGKDTLSGTWTNVTANIWDYTYSGSSWNNAFSSKFMGSDWDVDVIDGNLDGVTSAQNIFSGCSALRNVVNIRSFADCVNLYQAFWGASNVKHITLNNLGPVIRFDAAFSQCSKVEDINLTYADESAAQWAVCYNMCFNCAKLVTAPHIVKTQDLYQTFIRNYELRNVPCYNTASCNRFEGTFYACTSLTQLPNFDMSYYSWNGNGPNLKQYANDCESLTVLPDLSSLVDGKVLYSCEGAFSMCYNVADGITAAYNKLSSLTPQTYAHCFYNCGRDTVTGAAQLANIPDDWKEA